MRASCNRPIFATLVAAMGLAGCSGGAPDGGQAPNATRANAATLPENGATANITAPVAKAQAIETKIDGFEFSYKWPAEAAAIPALNDWLRSNGEKLLTRNKADAMEAKADAKENDYPFHGSSYAEDYDSVTSTPRMLILVSEGYVYTGGAHGMPVTTAILWDKVAQKRLAIDSMIDVPRLAALTKARFCAALDEQREEKRGEPVRRDNPNAISEFDQCIDMTKQLLVPLSGKGKALDTVRVMIGPYEAGPYAEGSYEVDLPMDKGMLATVKPAYRDAFATAR